MPNPQLRRLATPQDLSAVYDIYMHPEVVPFLGIDPVPIGEFESVFATLVATGTFYVVPRDSVVRGFYRENRQKGRSRHVVTLETLAIAPSEKGSGFAAAVIEEAILLMRADGVLRVELLVEADNPRGIAFYRKLGFEQEGRLRSAYKRANQPDYVDEILMARILEN
jgi:ribosomal protein S18 acetylase RimI-like enzyme